MFVRDCFFLWDVDGWLLFEGPDVVCLEDGGDNDGWEDEEGDKTDGDFPSTSSSRR